MVASREAVDAGVRRCGDVCHSPPGLCCRAFSLTHDETQDIHAGLSRCTYRPFVFDYCFLVYSLLCSPLPPFYHPSTQHPQPETSLASREVEQSTTKKKTDSRPFHRRRRCGGTCGVMRTLRTWATFLASCFPCCHCVHQPTDG